MAETVVIMPFANLLRYLFVQALTKEQRKIALWKVSLILFVMTVINIFLYLTRHIMDYAASVAILMIYIVLSITVMSVVCFEIRKRLAIFIAMFIMLIYIVVDSLAIFIFTNIHGVSFSDTIIQTDIHRTSLYVIQILLLVTTLAAVKYLNVRLYIGTTSKLTIVLCLVQIIHFIMVISLLQLPGTDNMTIGWVVGFGAVTVGICSFALTGIIIKRNEETRLLSMVKTQNSAQQKHIKQLMENHKQISKASHDFKHNINMLYALGKEQRIDELLESLSKLGSTYNNPPIVNTGNSMLDTMLSAKQEEAIKLGISFQLKLDVEAEAPYLSMELCVLLSNGLDNAIEACTRAASKRIIEMETISGPKMFMCRIRNTLGETPQAQGAFLKTKKPDSHQHGIGLRSMKQTCDELGGDMAFEYDDEFFMVHIAVPVHSG